MVYLLPVLVGILLGLFSPNSVTSGAWLILLLWALAGVGLGLAQPDRRHAIRSGALYGLSLSLAFLFSGFQGAPDKLPAFLLLVTALSLVAIAAGVAIGVLGNRLRAHWQNNRE